MATIEQQIRQRVPLGSPRAQVAAFVALQRWSYVKSAEEGAVLEGSIPGIPSGVLYCDTTGYLMVTFHFDRQGKLVSHTAQTRFGCL